MSQYPNDYHGHGSTPPPYHGGPPPGHGHALASLVCGIVALVTTWFLVGLVVAIVGIALAASAKRQGFVGGIATAGLVCSIIALALGGVVLLSCVCAACLMVPVMPLMW